MAKKIYRFRDVDYRPPEIEELEIIHETEQSYLYLDKEGKEGYINKHEVVANGQVGSFGQYALDTTAFINKIEILAHQASGRAKQLDRLKEEILNQIISQEND